MVVRSLSTPRRFFINPGPQLLYRHGPGAAHFLPPRSGISILSARHLEARAADYLPTLAHMFHSPLVNMADRPPDPRSKGVDVLELPNRDALGLGMNGGRVWLRNRFSGEEVEVSNSATIHFSGDFAYLAEEGRTVWCASLLAWSAWKCRRSDAIFLYKRCNDGFETAWWSEIAESFRLHEVRLATGDLSLVLRVAHFKVGGPLGMRLWVDFKAVEQYLVPKKRLVGVLAKTGLSGEHLRRATTEDDKTLLLISWPAFCLSLASVARKVGFRTQSSSETAKNILEQVLVNFLPSEFKVRIAPKIAAGYCHTGQAAVGDTLLDCSEYEFEVVVVRGGDS